MNKTLLTVISFTLLASCTAEIKQTPAAVTSHTRVNPSLDDCDRLGPINTEYETNKKLTQLENKIKAQDEIKQKAYDQYRANNIVFINTRYVEGGFRVPDMIYNRGIAYRCY